MKKKLIKMTKNAALLSVLTLYASSAFAQVNDGTGALGDLQTWLQTILPIIAGCIMAALSLAWGNGWIQGSWVPKSIAGAFGSGVAFYVVGIFM